MARYDSFLLRIWRSTRQEGLQVAFRLEHIQSGESFQCQDIGALHALLDTLFAADIIPSVADAEFERQRPAEEQTQAMVPRNTA